MFPLLRQRGHRQRQGTQDTHSVSEMEQMLQDNCMFTHIHLIQKESWRLVRETIATHTNFFSEQQEQDSMISLSKKITVTSLLHQPDAEDLMGDIIRKKD